jgi:hypothetical protein
VSAAAGSDPLPAPLAALIGRLEDGVRTPPPPTGRDPLRRLVEAALGELIAREPEAEAIDAARRLAWTDADLVRVTAALRRAWVPALRAADDLLTPRAIAILRALDRPDRAGEGQAAYRAWRFEVGAFDLAERSLPELPAALSLTLEGVRDFARLLGASFDERFPAAAGLHKTGWAWDPPEELAARHIEADGDDPVPGEGRKRDMRLFQPYASLAPLGGDATGDGLYLAPHLRTKAGPPPVVRFCHDQRLTAELEANGLWEYAARGLLHRWADAHGVGSHPHVRRLLSTPVALAGV